MKYSNALGSIDREKAVVKVSGKTPKRFADAVKKYRKTCVATTHPTDFDPVLDPTQPRIGPWLVTGDDVILDFIGGVATRVLGSHHPKIREMVDKCHQYGLTEWKDAGTDFYYSTTTGLPMTHDLAELVIKYTNKEFGGDYMMFPVNTGAEAVSNCAKISYYNKFLKVKKELGDKLFAEMCKQLDIAADPAFDGLYLDYPFFGIAFLGAFHGRTMDVLSLTKSKPVHKEGFPQLRWIRHFTYNTTEFEKAIDYTPLKKLIQSKKLKKVIFEDKKIPAGLLAYIIVEPVQGEGGYNVADPKFLKAVSTCAKKCNAYYIDDEVQAGMGRTGKLWAAGHFGVKPDCISTAKALLIGAVLVRRELGKNIPPAKVSSTWGGGDAVRVCQSYATVDAMFNYKDAEIGKHTPMENATLAGKYFLDKLNGLKKKYPKIITGARTLGLMCAFDVKDAATRDKIEEIAWYKGLIILGCGKKTIRLLPPLDVRKREMDICVDILDATLKQIK